MSKIRKQTSLVKFKVSQAIGSLAIEGINVSRAQKESMLLIASGKAQNKDTRQAIVARYRQDNLV